MIPVNLQAGLKNKLEKIFKNLRLKNPNGEEVAVNIYEQHLPQGETSDDLSHYPYVLIKLSEGELENETSPHRIKVLFVIGVFDDSYDNQGYKDVVIILQKLLAGLNEKPIIDKKFILARPLRWAIYDEDVYPFYFGGVETFWETNAHQHIDEGGFLHYGRPEKY